jgi:hypothetical protein
VIRLRLAFVAENIIRDAATNSVSAFNIVDELSAHGFPLLVPKLSAVVVLSRENGDAEAHELILQVTLNGQPLNQFSLKLNFQGVLLTRGIMLFQGFVVPQPGHVAFEFSLNGKPLTKYELEARLVNPPTPTIKVQ